MMGDDLAFEIEFLKATRPVALNLQPPIIDKRYKNHRLLFKGKMEGVGSWA